MRRRRSARSWRRRAAVRRITGELADLAERAAADAERLLANATQSLRRGRATAKEQKIEGTRDAAAGRRQGRLARAVNDLSDLVEATRQMAAQTRQRLRGQTPTAPPTGQPARPRRPPDCEGPPRQALGVRPQSTDRQGR
jgi:transposase, IS5 family